MTMFINALLLWLGLGVVLAPAPETYHVMEAVEPEPSYRAMPGCGGNCW